MSILIRDQTARIEYSVALNDATIRRLIQEWEPPKSSSQPASKTTIAPSRTHQRNSKTAVATNTDSRAARSINSSCPENDADQDEHAVTPTDDLANQKNLEKEFENDRKLVAEFRELVADKLAAGLIVTCQDREIKIRRVNLELPPKYHRSATVQFEFSLPAEKMVRLTIQDNNFRDLDGGARYALKVSGSAILAKSNIAPILVRADRIEFADLSPAARERACSINAQIIQAIER